MKRMITSFTDLCTKIDFIPTNCMKGRMRITTSLDEHLSILRRRKKRRRGRG